MVDKELLKEYYFLLKDALKNKSSSILASYYAFHNLLDNEKYRNFYKEVKGVDLMERVNQSDDFLNLLKNEYPLLMTNLVKLTDEFSYIEVKIFPIIQETEKYVKGVLEEVDSACLDIQKKKLLTDNIGICQLLLTKDYPEHKTLTYLIQSRCEFIQAAVDVFQKELKKLSPTTQRKETNTYPLIFKDGKFDLFTKIRDEYITQEWGAKAKYSELYRYFKDKNWLLCNQLEYIDFVKEKYNVEMSKILSTDTYKYNGVVVTKFDEIIGLNKNE